MSTPTNHNNQSAHLDRRTLLRTAAAAGLAGAAAPLLAACAQRVPPISTIAGSTTPAANAEAAEVAMTPPATSSPVAFVATTDRAAGVRRAIDLLGPLGLGGQRVAIKPNFNSADPAPGSTHPDVLRSMVGALQAEDAAHITVADRSGMGDTRRVMETLGVDKMAEELDFDLVVLDELSAEEWVMIGAEGTHWARGFPIARLFTTADAVVQACCLKTHRFGGHFTLSLKNSVGMVAKRRPGDDYNYMGELHSSHHQRTMIAEVNAAYAPALVIMDGVEAFVRGGPDQGERVAANVVLASRDRVAIDAVGIALLRHFGTTPEVATGPIFAQEQIARAVALGLGAAGPDQIELLTPDAESAAYAATILEVLQGS
jgi:uncharacterized protein (DUF362 family)